MDDDLIEGLNRSAKLFIDSGLAATVEEAMERLKGFRMHISIGDAAAGGATHQAALLTALNCARRTFLGGVTVSGSLDVPLVLPVVPGETVADAVRHLLGRIVDEPPVDVPLVAIGTPAPTGGFGVRATFDGWRAGVMPRSAEPLAEASQFAPAGVLSGALAVAEVFAHLAGDAMAGHRAVGMSLWNMGAPDWRSGASDGPAPDALPADFWLIGLGHLGQAFLWTIGFLPYPEPREVRLFLQDVDAAGASTESTSVLTFGRDEGEMKTRVCATWAKQRGFATRLIERRFDRNLRVAPDEPALALCGVDNPQARAVLEEAGFATIFEAGLGDGAADFRLIRTHSFPASVGAEKIWADNSAENGNDEAVDPNALPPAYTDLHKRGSLDQCGLTRLAGVAVGAPFVGMAAAAVLIAQVIRMATDGARPSVANLDLSSPQHRSVVMRDTADIVVFKTVEI
jgi:hypothetical protein